MLTNEQEKEKIMGSIAQKYQQEGIKIDIEKGLERVAQNMFLTRSRY